MSELKVSGKIVKILEKVTGTKKDGSGEWVKQSFVIDNGEKYNNLSVFEMFGEEKVENLNKYNKVGDNVEVSFNINCNEWQGKYYTTLQAWKVLKAESNAQQVANEVDANFEPATDISNNDNDPLPF